MASKLTEGGEDQAPAVLRANAGLEERTRDGVAESERALAQLRDSERDFRLLVQSVTDYAIYMLDPNGHVVSWNVGAERIKGYSRDEIVGKHYSEFFTDIDREERVPWRALKIAAESGRYESEGWRVRKDGSRFWAFAVLDAVYNENGELLGFAKITRDMTERREAQLQLEQAKEQLAQAQKMEAIGQLTGGIAHDFNNLLMIVGGQAQLLRRRSADPAIIRGLDAIEAATRNGANLTRQLLTFARRQRLEPVDVSLEARINAVHDLLASSVGGAIELTMDIPRDLWPVMVDASELDLAMVNIAVNARDAMPNGGRLKVVARNVELDLRSPVGLSGEFVVLEFTDSGTGISADNLSKIFEPFFTTKEVGKGTGLGLSQVYGFARQSGGEVKVSSLEGEGTTVSLFLPRSQSEARPAGAGSRKSDAPAGEGTILLVEDNPQVAEVTRLLLEQLGFRVLVTAQPSEVLGLLEKERDVRLVLSDIVMPGAVDGLALAADIRKHHRELPILLATGYSSAAERAGRQFQILRKPYDLAALSSAVKHAMQSAEAQAAAE